MTDVTLYIKPKCPFSIRAQKFFEEKNIPFKTLDITDSDTLRSEMINRSNGRITVPQIFINGHHIGGCDDLLALDASGKLSDLINNR